MELNGEGPLVHKDFYAYLDLEGCTVLTYPAGGFENGTFEVFSLFWTIDDPKKEQSKVIDLKLEFDVESRDIFTLTGNCIPGSEPRPDAGGHWDYVFYERHSKQEDSEVGHTGATFIFKNWEILGGELFATLEWQEPGTYSETGSFVLYHRPGQ
jgi:hypothetical protein